jgi:hypothetical protein
MRKAAAWKKKKKKRKNGSDGTRTTQGLSKGRTIPLSFEFPYE